MIKIRIIILISLFLVCVLIGNIFGKNKDIIEKYISAINLKPKKEEKNILQYSTLYVNEFFEEKIRNILYDKNNIFNVIKYLEGTTTWSKWYEPYQEENQEMLNEMSHYFVNFIKSKLSKNNVKIVFEKLNRLRKNQQEKALYLYEHDFVFYKTDELYAYHFNILSVVNETNKEVKILYANLMGKINDEYLNNIYLNDDDNLYYVNYQNKNKIDIQYSKDSMIGLKSQDKELKDILHKNIMQTDDISNEEDYKKNIEYMKNQNEVRKMFLNNLVNDNNSKINSNNIYKNYPYKNDVKICQ